MILWRFWETRRFVFLSLLLALVPQVTSASTIMYATGPITIGSGSPENAEADITLDTSAQTVAIALINNQLDPKNVISTISGIEIDFANLSSAATAAIASTTATTFTINPNGTISGVTTSNSNAWLAETDAADPGAGYASNTVALCVVCKNVNGTNPLAQFIIGGPSNRPWPYGYKDGDNTIGKTYDTFILGSGSTYIYDAGTVLAGADTTPSWVLNIPQIQVNTTITTVRFYFGAAYSPNDGADATIVEAAEPGPFVMVTAGLLLVVVGAWKRRGSLRPPRPANLR
jgi:hypothetical protein